MKKQPKRYRETFSGILFAIVILFCHPQSVMAQDPPDCNSPVGASVIVTGITGSPVFADTLNGPFEVKFYWQGSPKTFWFDVAQDFDFDGVDPNAAWGDCQMNGNATWEITPSAGTGIDVWSEDDADITFNSTGSWTVTATHPGSMPFS